MAAILATVVFCASVVEADAARRHRRGTAAPGGNAAAKSESMGESGRYAAFVVDGKTGKVLFSRNADAQRYPASLTKMMTLYVLFEELERGRVKLDTPFEVSAFASNQAPSKLGLRPGDTIEVGDAIRALVTKSANDVAVVIAENLSGSQDAFAARMTRTARRIGMSDTTFRNASGLPNPGQLTTAKDMVTLGLALQDRFPDYYRFFSTRAFAWRGGVIGNHNRLLGRVEGIDGIKTGYTQASGFNLVSSIRRDGRHLVAAVMGGPTGRSRDNHMAQLLETYLPSASRGSKTFAINDTGRDDAPAPTRKAGGDKVASIDGAVTRTEERAPIERGAAVAMAKAILLPEAGSRPAYEPISILPPSVGTRTAAASVSAFSMPTLTAAASPAPAPAAPASSSTAVRSAGLTPPGAIPGSTASGYADPRRTAGEREIDAIVTRSVDPAGRKPDPRRAETAKPDAGAKPDPVKSDAASGTKGWMVQIAAVDTESAAKALLTKARGQVGGALSGSHPVAEAVSKGSSTFYRARFAGFADQAAANAACASLKRSNYACLALRQ